MPDRGIKQPADSLVHLTLGKLPIRTNDTPLQQLRLEDARLITAVHTMTEAIPNTCVDWQVKLKSFREGEALPEDSYLSCCVLSHRPLRNTSAFFYVSMAHNHLRDI